MSGRYVQTSPYASPGIVYESTFRMQNFVAADQFCFRGCHDAPNAPELCNHIYDVMGCAWNMPGNYNPGFDSCQGDSGAVRLIHYSKSPST